MIEPVKKEIPKELHSQKARCQRIIFNKGAFYICSFEDDDSKISFTAKGVGSFREGFVYDLFCILEDNSNSKYADTYTIKSTSGRNRDISELNSDKESLIKFLQTITSETIANKIIEQLGNNAVKVLSNGERKELMKVDGVGEFLADKIINSFKNKENIAFAFTELSKYNLTEKQVVRIVKHYNGNVDLAVDKVNENPYNITEVNGIGFKKADTIFLYYNRNNPNCTNDPRRISAYINFLFDEEFQSGNTYLTPKQFYQKVKEYIPNVEIQYVADIFKESPDYISLEINKEVRLCKKKFVELELFVANNLIDRIDSEKPTVNDNIHDVIKRTEYAQGFDFSQDQLDAIHTILNENVFILQGLAGTGKTSVIKAVTNYLMENNLMFYQCCLSGKAADNMRKVSGYPASTIHSLLGIGGENDYSKKDVQLECDAVIVDEISMVDINIFSKLIKAMPKKCKLIMMGDTGQLDSIGVNVTNGMIESGVIPSFTLEKIHRQAQKSAIITHSISMRQGKISSEVNLKDRKQNTYGENQDLHYHFVDSDKEDEILNLSLAKFKETCNEYGVDNTQIICSTRATGKVSVAKLNDYAQKIANPVSEPSIVVNNGESEYTIRVLDRVINTKNMSPVSRLVNKPIFNGNTGRVLEVEENRLLINFDGIGEVEVYKNGIQNIQLGYAITCHKAQGSTIENVIIALPFHFMLNSRELVYTALTRASKNATIVTSPKTLKSALSKSSKKIFQTNLGYILRNQNNKAKFVERGN